ncbi:MAG: YciI family protein [Actinomycetota bacterium]|nr:YciI family protein [Actinomycetota bacterium]
MKVMVMVKATEDTENGVMPTEDQLSEMTAYNEQLLEAGIMLDGDGLHPSSKGVRIAFDSEGNTAVTDGPFTETKELLAGYWVWQVKDMDEATEWLKRAPFRGGELEIRPFFAPEDFGDALTPEIEAKEAEMRKKLGTD